MITTRLLLRLPERSFSFNSLVHNPSDSALYDLAQALNSLQSEPLVQVVKVERQAL